MVPISVIETGMCVSLSVLFAVIVVKCLDYFLCFVSYTIKNWSIAVLSVTGMEVILFYLNLKIKTPMNLWDLTARIRFFFNLNVVFGPEFRTIKSENEFLQ